jgi:hypothetical protein
MSTEINITVEGEGLVDIDKRYRQENRDNEQQRREKLLADKQKAAADAKKEEDEKRRKGTPQMPQLRRDEPAANRLPPSPAAISWFSWYREPATRYPFNGGLPNFMVVSGGNETGISIGLAAYNSSALYDQTRTHQAKLISGDGKSVGIGQPLVIPPSAPPVLRQPSYEYTYFFESIPNPNGSSDPYVICKSIGTITGTLGRNANNAGFRQYVLPSGNGNCIVIIFTRHASADIDVTGTGYGNAAQGSDNTYYGGNTRDDLLAAAQRANANDPYVFVQDSYLQNLSYSVSNTVAHAETTVWSVNSRKIRQIDPPQYILNFNPPIQNENYYPHPNANPVLIPSYGSPLFDGVFSSGFGPVGPEIFNSFNLASQFVNQSQIDPAFNYPFTNVRAIQRNYTKGVFYNKLNPITLSDLDMYKLSSIQEFYYKLKKRRASIYLEKARPDLVMLDDKVSVDTGYLDGASFWPKFYLLEAFDGGDPAYCTKMLLAMGFSASDLVP